MLFAITSKVRKKRKNFKINREDLKKKLPKNGRSSALSEYLAGLVLEKVIFWWLLYNNGVHTSFVHRCWFVRLQIMILACRRPMPIGKAALRSMKLQTCLQNKLMM